MTSRSCAAEMISPPAAAISTTATYSPALRVKSESMSSRSVSAVRTRMAHLRDACRAARGEQKIAAGAEAAGRPANTAQSAAAQPATPSRAATAMRVWSRGLAQKSEIDDEHEQRGDFESRFRQRGAEEGGVVHCAPPASSAFTAGSI